MNRKLAYTAAIATLCLAGAGAGVVAASDSEQNDALGINDAKISLTEAISAAEQHVGGKASSAEYEHEKGQGIFEVEVLKGTQVMDVTVDPNSGKVLRAENDKADQGDDQDGRRDEDQDGDEVND